MKNLSSATKNNIENKVSYTEKNFSDINTSATSPIKVRKKLFGLNTINSEEGLKILRLSNLLSKKIPIKTHMIINTSLFIKKSLDKYNSTPFYFYKKLTNQILFNFPHHLVCIFKDYLIWDENYDYIKNFYQLNKSNELIPKLGNYYETYTLFTPIYFPLMDVRDIITKYIKNKIKFLEIAESEDDIRDELKDIDRNIIDCDTNNENNANNNNNNESNEENKELISSEMNKENNEQKMINSKDINTENSHSISKYFGIDSIIKSKELSNYSLSDKFERQIDNYSSILEQIKNKNQNDNKIDTDFSLELASLIQSFEENKKINTIVNNTKKVNPYNKKKSRDLEKNKMLIRIGNYNITDTTIFKPKTIDNSRTRKKSSKSLNSKKRLNIPKLKKITHNAINSSKNICISNPYRNLKLDKINILFNNNSNNESKSENKYNYKKTNDIRNNSETHKNIIYKSFISGKAIRKNKFSCLIRNNKKSLSKNDKNLKNIFKKFENYKILQKNREDSTIKFTQSNRTMNLKSKSKSKNKEKDDLNNNFNKTREYSLIYTSPSINLKNSLKSVKNIKNIRNIRNIRNLRNKNSSKSLSQSKTLHNKTKYPNIDIKKFIFVKKKESNNSIFGTHKNIKYLNIIDSSFNALNISNKIIVNKMENFKKSAQNENKIITPKGKNIVNTINLNNTEAKYSLNYNSFTENDYTTFIPRTVIRKMFNNKVNNGKFITKLINISPTKKHDASSKNLMTWSSIIGNNSKINTNYENQKTYKNLKSKLNFKNRIKHKNLRTMTDSNKFITITSPSKIDNKNNFQNLSKVSVFTLNESNPSNKNRNKFCKVNIREMRNNAYSNKTLQVNNKKSDIKKCFDNKDNLMINVNIFNDIKFNPETQDDKTSNKSNQKKELNNTLKLTYINKNRIKNLINNCTIGNSFLIKNNKKNSKEKNAINNNHFYTIDTSTRILRKERYFKLK